MFAFLNNNKKKKEIELIFIYLNIINIYYLINLFSLFRFKNAENQYMSHKKYGVHLKLSGPFDLVCLQYSSSVRNTHSPSVRASSPTTRTANFTLGLKRPILRPRYTIYYYVVNFQNSKCYNFRPDENIRLSRETVVPKNIPLKKDLK